jgi:hypothetical protein
MAIRTLDQIDHSSERFSLTLNIVRTTHGRTDIQSSDYLSWRSSSTA